MLQSKYIIILIIKKDQDLQAFMSENRTYQTPLKEQQQNLNIPQTTDLTPQHLSFASEQKVDYRAKTFKLMKQLAQAQVHNKKFQTQMRHLEKEIQAYRKEFDKFFNILGAHNLEEAYKRIQSMVQTDKKLGNEDKVNQWTNLIEQYKKIINTQQYKYIKLEQQFKISEVKLKRYEQDKFQTINREKNQKNQKAQKNQKNQRGQEMSKSLMNQIKSLKQEKLSQENAIFSLGQEVSILKRQYKQAIVERDHFKDMFEQLQNKYNLQIQHFEEMEKHVEQRLIEVERQMTYYRQQRQEHLQKIDLMKKQIDLRQDQAYFSFGGMKNVQSQTQEEEILPQFNNQCLQISIKTLLQQNQRLKNTLVVLYSKKSDEKLPKEIQLQLKILLNMKQNILKQQKRDAQRNQAERNQGIEDNQGFRKNQENLEKRQEKIPETIKEEENEENEQEEQQESRENKQII